MKARTISATDFRVNLRSIMEEVYNNGMTVVVEKHSKVMFVVSPPSSLSDGMLSDPDKGTEETVEDQDDTPTAPAPPSRPGKVQK